VCDGLYLGTLLRSHWESPCHTTSDGVPRGNSGYILPDINSSCWVLIGTLIYPWPREPIR
jgi:hypothetical protein